MLCSLAIISLFCLQLLSYVRIATPLSTGSSRLILPNINQTEALRGLDLTQATNLTNGTSLPRQNFISYRVSGDASQTTLLFHSFGPKLDGAEVFATIHNAINVAFSFIRQGLGCNPIAKGLYIYSHEFITGDEMSITIADFRETGRSITYLVLCETIRGIGEFMTLPEIDLQTLSFEVEVDNIGYSGTGHFGFKKAGTLTTGFE